MTKRIISLLTTLVMAISLAGVLPAVDATAETYSGSCGSNATWSLDTSTGVFTVSGTGDMTNYTFEDIDKMPWSKNHDSIKSVVINSGITSIGDFAFSYCTKLKRVNIPNSIKTIGENAFYWCESMTNITIPNSVTSIGDQAFANCLKLKKVKILNKSTEYNDFCFTSTPWLRQIIKKAIKNTKVTKLRVKSKQGKSIGVLWKRVKKAEGYLIQVSTNKKFNKGSIIGKRTVIKNKKKETVKNLKVESGKIYYVRIRPYKVFPYQAFVKEIKGKWSKPVKVKIK